MSNKLYTLNEHYFDQIDTEDKAYFLGLLYADGCNYEDQGVVKIDLIEQDSYILEQLIECLNYTGQLAHYKAEAKTINGKSYECQPSCRLVFRNKHISETLASYGLISNKSKYGKYIKNGIIPDYLYNHWVRGLLDGDGGLAYWVDNKTTDHKKFQIHYCKTTDMVNSLAGYLKNKFDCKPDITNRYSDRENNNLQFSICGNNVVRRISDWLYKDAHYYLKRKYDKYLELIKENERKVNNKTLYGSMHPRRKVMYLPTGQIYESLADAERATGTNRSNICVQAKKGNGKWQYYDEMITASYMTK